ncbi:hypothetical protein [Azospirillum palustre]
MFIRAAQPFIRTTPYGRHRFSKRWGGFPLATTAGLCILRRFITPCRRSAAG